MSLLLPFGALAAAGFVLAKKYDAEMSKMREERKEQQKRIPNAATFAPYNKVWNSKITPSMIASVHADVDLRGIPFFHTVLKGSGVAVRSYRDPRSTGIGYDE